MNSIRLLARPRWVDGESWSGFLLRIANANYLAGVACLARYLGVTVQQILVAQPREVLLHLGYSVSEIPVVRYPHQRIQASRAGKKGNRRYNSLIMRGRRVDTAVCPQCLANDDTPHIRAIWERPLEVGCRVHQTLLLSQCRACGKKLSVRRPQMTECTCGESYLKHEMPRLSESWAPLLFPFSLERSDPARETFQPTSYQELVATSAIERLALYERQLVPNKRKRRSSAKLAVADMQLALPWFAHWPKCFEQRYRCALEKGRDEGEDRRTSYIQAKTLFAPMFPRLHKVVRRVARDLNYRPRACLQLGPEDYLGSAEQSVTSAMKLLNMSRAQVWWMANRGVLAGATKVSSHAMNIPTESVLDVMSRLPDTEDWATAADRRGCRRRAMKQLLRVGLIDAIPLGDYGESRVVAQAWDEFADFLLSTSKPVPQDLVGVVPVDAVIGASQQPAPDPHRTARIVQAIASGTLPLYARSAHPRRVDELLVSTSKLKAVAQRDG